jgi:hypothetical protein
VLKAGDTLQLQGGGQALITFFEDSQRRLSEQATVVSNRIDPLARQGTGLIDVSLLAGQAWLQALNIPDHFHSITLGTPQAVIGADQTSLAVSVSVNEVTTVQVFKHQAAISVLNQAGDKTVAQTRLTAGQAIRTIAANEAGSIHTLADVTDLTETARQEPWVLSNRAQDEVRLLALQERELDLRKKVAGVLPGHFLYPLKQAKERLTQALALTRDQQNQLQLRLANKRLTEAIVLANQKQFAAAQNALLAYKSIVRELAKEAKVNRELKTQVEEQLIVRNTRSLVASLPKTPLVIVREAIDSTEELITENPLEREQVRLKNMIASLSQLPEFIEVGNFTQAEAVLVGYETMESRILTEASALADETARKQVLNDVLALRSEGLSWIKNVKKDLEQYHDADVRFVGLITAADQAAQREINKVNALVAPLLPPAAQTVNDPLINKAERFVERVEIYNSWSGQKNQISLLLSRMNPKDRQNLEFLARIRLQLSSPRARDLINAKMLELKSTARYNKHKAVERKIERAKRLRGE